MINQSDYTPKYGRSQDGQVRAADLPGKKLPVGGVQCVGKRENNVLRLPVVRQHVCIAFGVAMTTSWKETIWGYEVFYRAMLSLKADGTFSFSSGTADNGFGYKKPEGAQIHRVELAESVSSYDSIEYFLNGKKVSERMYRDAVKVQDQKPDVIWYDLTHENLSSALKVITD